MVLTVEFFVVVVAASVVGMLDGRTLLCPFLS